MSVDIVPAKVEDAAEASRWRMRLGIGTLHLEVENGNEAATRLYRSAGFEESGRRLMRRRIVRA